MNGFIQVISISLLLRIILLCSNTVHGFVQPSCYARFSYQIHGCIEETNDSSNSSGDDSFNNNTIKNTSLSETLSENVKKMNQVMTPQFFESTSSLKALYMNCAKNVEIKNSSIPGAGLGLFAKKSIKAGTIVSFYPVHALGVEVEALSTFKYQPKDEEYFNEHPCTSSSYLHCTDQPLFKRISILSTIDYDDIPLYLDVNPTKEIVPAWVSQMINDGATVKTNSEQGVLDYYHLSKKMRNCIHIPFGPSPMMATVTTKKVKKGEELFTTYGGTYWLGVLLDIHGEEGVGVTFKIQKEIKDTAADLVACMNSVSKVYGSQAKELELEYDKLLVVE